VSSGDYSIETVHHIDATVEAIPLSWFFKVEWRTLFPAGQVMEGAHCAVFPDRGVARPFFHQNVVEARNKSISPESSVRRPQGVDTMYPTEPRVAPNPPKVVALDVAGSQD
jgi:hypothetical protein